MRETDWGTMYDAYRPADPGNIFHRFAHFMFPCFALVPDGTFSNMIQATLSVPLDDNHTMTYNLGWSKRDQALRTLKDGNPIPGAALTREFLPTTDDWLGRWRLVANRSNDYLIDRDLQKSGKSFSGINGIGQQDQAMVESMEGPEEGIVDRSFEHLAASDRMIAITRRRLIAAAQAHQKDGTVPSTVDRPELTRGARGGSFIAPESVDWLEAYAEELRKAQSPTGFLRKPRNSGETRETPRRSVSSAGQSAPSESAPSAAIEETTDTEDTPCETRIPVHRAAPSSPARWP